MPAYIIYIMYYNTQVYANIILRRAGYQGARCEHATSVCADKVCSSTSLARPATCAADGDSVTFAALSFLEVRHFRMNDLNNTVALTFRTRDPYALLFYYADDGGGYISLQLING